MSLGAGDRLGPYEILSPLGAGGMGEVYRARDPRLGREVAVKVLPVGVSRDPDRLRRFEQEARAAGQLEHPGLLVVFDVGMHEGAPFIVSELLRGETLRERLGAGPLPRPKAIEVAAQIARGLGAAHGKGVVHRDLKPENLFLTRDGRAKILDFGLARVAPELEDAGPRSEVATLSALTAPGAIVGTVGYMSPEQVRGEPTDARSDIFSLGAVIYEMLTGRRAFRGGSAVETLGAILKDDPPRDLPPFAPGGDALWRVVKRCLEKRREDRFQGAEDLAFALELAQGSGTSLDGGTAGPVSGSRPAWGPWLPWLAAFALAAAALAGGWLLSRRGGPAPASTVEGAAEATLTPLTVDPGDESDPSFSPDNETLAYASDRTGDYEIYLQRISGGPAINLTRDPGDDVQPSFSPDGRWIAFVSTRQTRQPLFYRSPRVPLMGGDVWVMPALGGPPRRVVEEGNFPSWSPDGRFIYYVMGRFFRSEIRRVPAGGGAPETIPLRLPKGSQTPTFLDPSVSPDGRWLLFCIPEAVYLAPAEGGEARPLVQGRHPVFSADSRSIVYSDARPGKNHSVWSAAFDAATGGLGVPRPLTFGTGEETSLALSHDAKTVAVTSVDRRFNLEALPFDAEGSGVRGAPITLTAGRHHVRFFGPSPDGRSVVYEDERGAESHLWRLDLGGAEAIQLTLDPRYAESFPQLSPDGRTIAFARNPAEQLLGELGEQWLMSADGGSPRATGVSPGGRAGWLPDSSGLVIYQPDHYVRLDLASGKTAPLLESVEPMALFSVSADGKWLAGHSSRQGTVDVLATPMDGSTAPRWVVQTPAQDGHSFFSPSGRWLYFQPDHKNIFRVPGPAQGWRATPPEKMTHFPERGLYLEEPQISRDGRTLFYARATILGDIWLLRLHGR